MTRRTCTLLRNREGLEPRHESRSVASQHCTVITACAQTEGRNLSAHLDLCVSFVTQKISQNRLSVAACPVAQAIGDPASNPAVLPARTVTMPFLASVSCPCIRGSVHSLAVLPARTARGDSACKVHVSHLHVPCVWRRIRRCRPLLHSATSSLLPSLLHAVRLPNKFHCV